MGKLKRITIARSHKENSQAPWTCQAKAKIPIKFELSGYSNQEGYPAKSFTLMNTQSINKKKEEEDQKKMIT